MFITCILICSLVLDGCRGTPPLASSPSPIFSQTPPATTTPIPSSIVVNKATPTLNHKTIIITPDDLFTIPGLKWASTPNSADYCEHIPEPQVSENANEVSLINGRFSLCVSHSWPWVKTAIDLDTGTLVSLDDKSGDIAMDYTHPDLNGETSYFVYGLNNAHIDEIDTSNLTYNNCEKLELNQEDPGSFSVHEGGIACVVTTEGNMAIIRPEHLYPSNTQGVEFSFAVLKK
jgi:hypothetical protein